MFVEVRCFFEKKFCVAPQLFSFCCLFCFARSSQIAIAPWLERYVMFSGRGKRVKWVVLLFVLLLFVFVHALGDGAQ